MNLWLAFSILILSILDDVGAVLYVRRIVRGSRFSACLISGGLTALISVEVLIYVSDPIYVVFNSCGSVIGTLLALWMDNKWPSKSKIRMHLNCPKCGKICSNPVAEITSRGIGKVSGLCKTHGIVDLGTGWLLEVSVKQEN